MKTIRKHSCLILALASGLAFSVAACATESDVAADGRETRTIGVADGGSDAGRPPVRGAR